MQNQITILKSSLNRSGGIEKNVWHIANAFLKRKFKVKLLTTEYSKDSPGLEVICFKKPKVNLSFNKILHFDRNCNSYLSKFPSKIVFGMDRNSFQTHIRAGNGVHKAYLELRKKTSSYFKSTSFSLNPLHKIILGIEKKSFESDKLKRLFVNSKMVKKQILKYYSTDHKKIKVVYNGVEWNQLKDPFLNSIPQQKKFCNHHNISEDSLKLFFAGNGYERKGLLNLLRALSLIKDKNFTLFVAGKEKSIKSYQKLAFNLKISDKVFFLGSISNLIQYYQLCDIFILPTIYDPFANVILEALSMGLYIITTKSNGASEIINSSQGTILNDPHSVDELIDALSNMINYRKDMTNAIKIRNSVSKYDYGNQLETILQECL